MSKAQIKKEENTETEQQLVPVTATSTAVTVNAGFNIDELAADAGAGSQQIKATDLQTPLIYLLQANSGQCKKSDGRYVPGASEGMMFNNLTSELYDSDKGFIAVPCYFEKTYVEWKANRGGLAGIHNADTPLKSQVTMTEVAQPDGSKKLVPLLPNGNLLVETNNHYILIVDESGSYAPAVIPLANTALKPSRQWNTLIKRVKLQDSRGQEFNPASYFMSYKVSTKVRTKDQNSWFTWNIESELPLIDPYNKGTPTLKNGINIYMAAKSFEKAVSSGAVKVKIEEPMDDGSAVGAADADDNTEI